MSLTPHISNKQPARQIGAWVFTTIELLYVIAVGASPAVAVSKFQSLFSSNFAATTACESIAAMTMARTEEFLRRKSAKHAGFSLIEVLVTVLVFSFGLLGLAGLQLVGLKNTTSAGNRYEATFLAYDILDRMRANRAQATTGAYAITVGDTNSGTGIALTDITAWKATLAALLPNGDGSIAVNGSVVTVTVQWEESTDLVNATAGTARVLMRTQL